MMKNVELVVSVVGDKRLTRKDVFATVKETHDVQAATVNRWLIVALEKGLLDRFRTNARGNEYAYFKAGGDCPLESERQPRESFTIQAACPACGNDKRIEFEGNSSDVEYMHGKMAWSCGGCGDYVRLWDCIIWRELLKLWTDWRDSWEPDMDIRLPNVSIGSFL